MRQLVTKYQPPGVVNKAGEIFVDEVTGQIKIGDGNTVDGVSAGVTRLNLLDNQDISTILPNVIASLPANSIVEFPANLKLYVSKETDLICKPGLKIRGNGCTISGIPSMYTTPVTNALVQSDYYFIRVLGYSLPTEVTSFVVTESAQSFTWPAGIAMPAKNDVVFLRTSNSTFGASGITRVEWTVKITDVNVSTRLVEIDDAFTRTETVINLTVYPNAAASHLTIEGLTFDLTDQPNIDLYSIAGLRVEGAYLPTVKNCNFIGNQYSVFGMTFQKTVHPLLESSTFSTFLNTQAINGGAARLGYGLTISRSRGGTIRHNTFSSCKHSCAQGGYGTGTILITDNLFSDSLTYESYYETASVGSLVIDAHSGHDGLLDVCNNTIKTCRTAVNCRAGKLNFSNNEVYKLKGSIDTGYAIVDFFETPVTYCNINNNSFYGLSPLDYLFSISSTVAYDNLMVFNNKLFGGTLWKGTVSSTVSIKNVTISNNILKGCQSLLNIIFDPVSTTHVFDNVTIKDNKFLATAATVNTALQLQNLSSVSTARPIITNFKITGNTIDQTACVGNVYVALLSRVSFVNFEMNGNTFIRGNAGQDFRGVYVIGCDLTKTSVLQNNIPDNDFTLENASQIVTVWTSVIIGDNTLYSLRFQEQGTTGFNFQRLKISRNDIQRAITGSPFSFTGVAGSVTWSLSTPVLVSHNYVTNNSVTRTISIDANSTGNKLSFIDNVLSRPIEDLSSTYFNSKGNILVAGTQTWKGGTILKSDGQLTAAAAPTTGTWTVGETVWNSVPATGAPAGWICSTAPTTFKAMAVLA